MINFDTLSDYTYKLVKILREDGPGGGGGG